MHEQTARVAVIGGGIAGLATAYRLEREAAASSLPIEIRVFEREARVGGKLSSRREHGFVIEEGPNGWLDNEPATASLLAEIGLNPSVRRSADAARHRFLLVGGRLRELPLTPPAFLKSDILPLVAKLRMACEFFVPRRRGLGRAAEEPSTDETIDAFGRRRLGAGFAATMLDPMVKGIFGGDSRRLSLAACFPRMVELESAHCSLLAAMIKIGREKKRTGQKNDGGAGGPSGTLHSLAGGMGEFGERLAIELADRIVLDASVEKVYCRDDRWHLRVRGEAVGPFDVVIDASPAHAATEHIVDPDLSRLLDGIPYAPMAVITLAYPREGVAHALDGFGMLVPSGEGKRLLGVLWSASIFPDRAPDGTVLLRCMAGGATDPDILSLDDGSLLELAVSELRELYGLRGQPERHWIIRHEKAIAQYVQGHPARLAAMDRLLVERPGLFLTGSAYRGVSVNHCIAEAGRVANRVCGYLLETCKGEVSVAALR